MKQFNSFHSIIPDTAVILNTKEGITWPFVAQKVTEVLINGEYHVCFSSLRSKPNSPVYFNETCVFTDADSEIIGDSKVDIHDFLESAGYTMAYYSLDNSEESGSLEP